MLGQDAKVLYLYTQNRATVGEGRDRKQMGLSPRGEGALRSAVQVPCCRGAEVLHTKAGAD